ncbi:hypothetical protein GCM10007049_24830 [Echinicola pacifica]|uniref:Helix-turn-helix domain-containing protein n=1 Tax=Echinicola pacifica TaxID=346377 RepID=A0A918USH0_9BACT|nr:Fic family protein [Echinicola pacifica]GGZ30926.1 hypothetical protein GCM10007049_24830 [Echinicola pacifica]
MKTLAQILQDAREQKSLTLKEAVMRTGVDAGLISKIERGKRFPSEGNLKAFSEAYELRLDALKKQWLVEKVFNLVQYEEQASEILALAESRVEYLAGAKALEFSKLSASVLAKLKEVDQLQVQWQQKRPLIGTQLQKMQEYFHVAYTYESNRIEGNTLSLQETHLVINEGITIGGKSMKEHLEAINHAEAVDFVEELVKGGVDFNARTLMELHYLVLKGIDRENAGKFRSVPVRISGSEHMPPQPYLLGKMMEDYFIHYNSHKTSLHPVILAAEMHERLVSVHPFVDGNGRTSRLVMNLILVSHGFTLANLKGDNTSRLAYYKALESVQVNNDPAPFYELVIDAVKDSLQQHLDLV